MPARPLRSAAALVCALSLILLLAIPAAAPAKGRLVGKAKRVTASLSNPVASTAVGHKGTASQIGDLLFGAHTDGDPYNGSVGNVDALQQRIDRRIGIVNWYQNWGGGDWISRVQPQVVKAVTKSDRLPLLTWEPWDPAAGAQQPQYRLDRIARGAHDGLIKDWARDLKALGERVYLRPMHEMNGTWYPWSGTVNGNTPGDYRAAWRHMHEVFERVGADNVRWVWCPLNEDAPRVPGNRMEKYYPGGRYVDVLALDGYNWGSTAPEFGGWRSFEQVFENAYRRLTRLGDQPVWIAEVGSAPEGGDKAKWVRNMFATAATWDRLKAIVWFDMDKEKDWRIASAAAAF